MKIASAEGTFDAHTVQPDAKACPTIVVLHETSGVNADMFAICEELAAEGLIALCPDLFWRQNKGLATHEAFDVDAGVRDAEATIAQARNLAAGNGRVGVMGFGLGGLLAFLTAARTCVDAAVAFYGGRTEEFINEAPDVDGPLQLHLAGEDELMTKAAQQEIVVALADNAQVEVHRYPGCHHAFSRRGGMNYDAAAASLSRARALEFFKRHL